MHDGQGSCEGCNCQQSQVEERHWQILRGVEVSKRVTIPESPHVDFHAFKLEALILVEHQGLEAVLVER